MASSASQEDPLSAYFTSSTSLKFEVDHSNAMPPQSTTIAVASSSDQIPTSLKNRLRFLKSNIKTGEKEGATMSEHFFRLINLFILVEGLLLGSVIGSKSNTKCKIRWFLYSLSFLAAVLYDTSLIYTAIRFNYILSRVERWKKEYNKEVARYVGGGSCGCDGGREGRLSLLFDEKLGPPTKVFNTPLRIRLALSIVIISGTMFYSVMTVLGAGMMECASLLHNNSSPPPM